MGRYLLKRALQIILVMLIVATIVFFLVNTMPGNPVYMYAGSDVLTDEEYVVIEQKLGLDKPIIERYIAWLTAVLRGDLGVSYKYHKPVLEVIGSRVWVTLYLSVISTLISMPVGILFGIITAVKRGKKADTVITLLANLTACLPTFWVGICLMYIFSLKLGWLPATDFIWPWEGLGDHIKHLIMPLFCLSLGGIASTARQTRSSMLEVIKQDYIRTARSKGVAEIRVIFGHMMRNGLIPIITLLGSRLAMMIGGSIFVEAVFGIPGMGSLIVNCITTKDVPAIQALVLLTALVSCIAFIITDILYVAVDPRISLAE